MRTTLRLLAGLVAGLAALTGWAGDIAIYERGQDTGFQLMVGDKSNWGLPVGGESWASAGDRVRLEPGSDDSSMSASWKGGGEGQLYFVAPEPLDLTPHVAAESALVFLVKVDRPPKRQAVLRMGCGFPCAGNADLTKVFKALPKGEWVRLSVDLQCFTTQGLDASKVDTPFLLLTHGRMGLELASIGLVEGMRANAAIRC